MFKKSQTTTSLVQVATAIGILVLTFSLMGLVLSRIKPITPNQIANSVNETLTWAGNNTAMSLTRSGSQVLASGSGQLYLNGSALNAGGQAGNEGNWSFNLTTGQVYLRNTSNFTSNDGSANRCCDFASAADITGTINFSYQYYYGSYELNSTKKGIEGNTLGASFTGVIAIVLLVTLLIGLLVVLIVRRFAV